MTNLFDSIHKPTLLLNEAAVRRNIRRMAEKARSAGVQFRPHFKTHQSAQIGEWFRAEGVQAITVSSVDMAQYFADHGWEDITLAFTANPRQAAEIDALASRVRLNLLVESVETVTALYQRLSACADVWIKVDVGAHRTGLPWDQPEAVRQVMKAVDAAPNLRLKGLLTHAGHTYSARGAEEVCKRYTESVERIDGLRRELSAGREKLMVSVGDTPGTSLCADLGAVDEIRPGNFVFFDAQQMQIGSCRAEDVTVALACPVVAKHPERCEVVVYGGAVHLSKDFLVEGDHRAYGYICLPEGEGWGLPLEGAYVSALSQEHGILRVRPEDLPRLEIGGLVCILPAHSCLTVTLMKSYHTLSGETIATMNL